MKAMRESASNWLEEYSRSEAELLKQGIDPAFAVMESDTDIHDRKIKLTAPTFWDSVVMLYQRNKAMTLAFWALVVVPMAGAILLHRHKKR